MPRKQASGEIIFESSKVRGAVHKFPGGTSCLILDYDADIRDAVFDVLTETLMGSDLNEYADMKNYSAIMTRAEDYVKRYSSGDDNRVYFGLVEFGGKYELSLTLEIGRIATQVFHIGVNPALSRQDINEVDKKLKSRFKHLVTYTNEFKD